MAKVEYTLRGNFDTILTALHNAILEGSATASLEDSSSFRFQNNGRCEVRVYERYSWTGNNRVSLTLTLVQCGQVIGMSAITAGGSQAMFLKLNTMGEEAFLKTVEGAARQFL